MPGSHSVDTEPTAPEQKQADPAPTTSPAGRGGWLSPVTNWVYGILVTVVILAGTAGAVRVWLSDRGFWNDELYIAANVRDLGVRGLFGALRYYQIAPLGWLVTEKSFLKVLGESEQALRLPAMVAAVATLILGVVLACRAIGRWAALLTGLLLATSPMLLTYAGELKQYTTEAAIALLVLLAADMYAADDRQHLTRRRRLITWIVIGMIAAVFSYSAMVVIAAALAAVVLHLWIRKRFPDMKAFLLGSIPVLALTAVVVFRRRMLPQLADQNGYFPTGFPPAHSNLPQIIEWLPRMWGGFVQSPLMWGAPVLVLLLVIGGLVSLVLRGRLLWAALLTAVLGVAICAAAVQGLPVQDRVSLYLLAPVALAITACVDGAVRGCVRAFTAVSGKQASAAQGSATQGSATEVSAAQWWSRTRPIGTAVGVVLAIGTVLSLGTTAAIAQPAVAGAYKEVTTPQYRDPGRDVLADVATRLEPGDRVVGYAFSKPLIAWYGRHFHLPVVGLATLGPQKTCHPETLAPILAGATRIWYVHGARLSTHPDDFNARVVAMLGQHGHVVQSKQINSASAALASPGWTLIDVKAGPDPHPATFPALPDYACMTMLPAPTY
ncbi:hypothetical protein GCM10009765_47210 [Fodinicola feengrottensis]|uniref:Glycosyltransferase RgtA/B/C/D-like domain-containing protein n=1 Tax=Fodinicola feengrottensis TaxID=435914 RepID=A0ABN2HRQ3_9ACTN